MNEQKPRPAPQAPEPFPNPGDHVKHSNGARFQHSSRQTSVVRGAVFLFLILTLALSGESASAQTGYTGIFGGGPFYKNAAANITEIENSGFTEAIVWSVEVSTTGDLNLNGEFPLTSGGAYVGNSYYPNFPSDMAT